MSRKLLENMVSIDSRYPGEGALATYMERYLGEHGFQVESQVIDGDRKNIYASRGSGDRAILFYGHLDTVALIEPSAWKTDPFQLTEKNGNLYGLGAYDMKGGIATFVEACKTSGSYVKILLGVDEENWSLGAWRSVEQRSSFFNDVELIISAEPNFGLGFHSVTNARTGRYLYNVTMDGLPAHVAAYREGIDAIQMLGEFISTFYAQRDELFHAHGSYAQVRRVYAESIGMSVCGQAKAEVEVLSAAEENVELVQKKIKSLGIGQITLKERPTPYLSGYQFPSFPYQGLIAEIIKRNTGQDLKLERRMSVADDNVLATLGIPVITWGPNGGNAHAPNEYVTTHSLRLLMGMYSQLLKSQNSTTQ